MTAPNTPAGTPAAETDPRIRAVLAAPRGRRFNRARPYVEPRPASMPGRLSSVRPEPPPADAAPATPPWLAQLGTDLGPHSTSPVRDVRTVRTLRRAARTEPFPDTPGRSRRPLPRPGPSGRARRDTARPGPDPAWSHAYACTVLGMLLGAYLLGLLQ